MQEVRDRLDGVFLPQDAERPTVSLLQNRQVVISFAIHGEFEEHTLREVAEFVRDDVLADPAISQVELDGMRPLVVGIEVDQETLRRFGLTLDTVADAVRGANVELPAGAVRTDAGEVLVNDAGTVEHVLLSRSDQRHAVVDVLDEGRDLGMPAQRLVDQRTNAIGR